MAEESQDKARSEAMPDGVASPSARSLAVAIWLRVGLILSALSAVNVIAHLDTFHDLSDSFRWLTGWWRYGLSTLFGWLQLRLTPLTQDVIALTSLAVGSSNLALFSRYRMTLLGLVRRLRDYREERPGGAIFETLRGPNQGRANAWAWAFVALGAIFIAVMGLKFRPFDIAIIISAACLALDGIRRFRTAEPLARVTTPWQLLLALCALPVLLILGTFSLLSYFRREIAWSAGLVAAILLTDQVFLRVFDPLWPVLEHLPKAPAVPAP